MWSLVFWRKTGERALRTAAQALLALWGTNVTGILQVDWMQAVSVAVFAAVCSVLMSIVASNVGDPASPSFLPAVPESPEEAGAV